MFLVRELMYCKPGKVRPLVDKLREMDQLGRKAGMPKMRLMTDFCAERYWTVVSEVEVASIEDFERMMQGAGQNKDDLKEMEKVMEGYHDLVEYGRREVYRIEA